MTDFRKLINLIVEGDEDPKPRDEAGRVAHPDIEYEVTADKVIARLRSYNSQVYTKLAQKTLRIKELSEEIKALEEDVKQSHREHIADLFSAEDTVRTRVVETVSLMATITKDPKATETVKYAKVLEELEKSLTPELIQVLTSLKDKFTTTTQKAPALKIEVNEGVFDKLGEYFTKFKNFIMGWASKYDAKLDALKASAGIMESAIMEDGLSEMDFGEMVDHWITDNHIRYDGEAGVSSIEKFAKIIDGGYYDIRYFLADNPGCQEAIWQWLADEGAKQVAWQNKLKRAMRYRPR